ncbi:hypothetical protein [Streptosporangium sp. OZ121]|uniref:hypothetical protein n=1 Tax=Streptosporangium sp. OZ121 TaxID=3444183 RepID=UPI003F78B364
MSTPSDARSALRSGSILLPALAGLMAGSTATAGAAASPPETAVAQYRSGVLSYTGTDAAERVVVVVVNGRVRISQTTPLAPGPGCKVTSDTAVNCDLTQRMHFNLRGGDDRLSAYAQLVGTVSGGAGDDHLEPVIAPGEHAIRFVGGDGTDLVSYTYSGRPVRVSLDGVADDGPAGLDDIEADVENVWGSSYADELTGSHVANRIEGGPGADVITGLGGDDVLHPVGGGFASDGPVRDDVHCGEGADTGYRTNAQQFFHDCENVVEP